MKFSAHHLLCFGASALIFVSALPSPALRQIDVRSVELLPRLSAPTKQQVADAAKQKAEDKAKDVAIKTGVKVAVKAAVAVTGAAIPVVGEIVEVAQMVEQIVELIVGAIKNAVKQDHAAESKFTQDIVSQASAKNSKWNYLAINEKLKQSVNLVGTKGKDWGVTERTLKIHFGTMKYYFYHFQEGTVENKGDGGYLNWAFIGKWERFSNGKPDKNGHLVKFSKH